MNQIKRPFKPKTPFKKLEDLKAELGRLQGVLAQSGLSEALKKRVSEEIAVLELRIKTAELEIASVKTLAKGCVTRSGKRIRV